MGKRDEIKKTSAFVRPGENLPTPWEATGWLVGKGTAPDNQALVMAEDGSIPVGHFRLTRVGLLVGDESVSFEEWQQIGQVLQRLDVAIQWLVGDWMAYGERVWGQTYEQVVEATGYDYQTLYNYTWVARNVDFSLRKEKLSFGHHALVAGLTPDEQSEWLNQAEAQNWSISQMRRAMKNDSPTPLASGADESLFSPEIPRNFKKMFVLGLKAGQGDRTVGKKLLSQIEEHRRWLDDFERAVREALEDPS
jgi:hypothetical protein